MANGRRGVVGDSGVVARAERGYVEPDLVDAVSKNPFGWDWLIPLDDYQIKLW